ncbi:hypothetical protein ACFL27_09540 [candidate division CSSED10-310 bacterium]|uniref:SMP-30/Gluconolactonase/LRE-like region domain-containing protein n=1 Tax=candidate division CSSED10-310 bacterium TaxID=2855610 RepID=A0ABV6YW39_UNCC1
MACEKCGLTLFISSVLDFMCYLLQDIFLGSNWLLRVLRSLTVPFLIFVLLPGCSDHIFDNPLDPDNVGKLDEFMLMFQSPAEDPGDLAWDGIFLWNCDTVNAEILQLYPYDGSLSAVLKAPTAHPEGLTYRKDNLWVSDAYSRRIIEVDSLTGREIFHFSAPGTNPKGLAYDAAEDVLYNIDANTLNIYKIDPDNGKILAAIASPSNSPLGLTYVNKHLYVASFSENIIYVIDSETGTKLDQFEGPKHAPIGLTWDDDNLWTVDWDTMIYRLTPSSP